MFDAQRGKGFLFSPKLADCLWGSSCLPYSGCWGLFPGSQAAGTGSLPTTHLFEHWGEEWAEVYWYCHYIPLRHGKGAGETLPLHLLQDLPLPCFLSESQKAQRMSPALCILVSSVRRCTCCAQLSVLKQPDPNILLPLITTISCTRSSISLGVYDESMLGAWHAYRLATHCLECRSLMKKKCDCFWKEGVLYWSLVASF